MKTTNTKGTKKMKITKSKLKQLIKEELQSIMEARGGYRSSGYYGTTDGDSGDPRFRKAYIDYSEPTGPSKPARKIPQLPPVEKEDNKVLDDAGLLARMLLGNGYSVELFDRSWRGSPDAEALLDGIRYIKDIDRSGDWNEIKAKAEEVIKRVSSDFIKRFDSDEEFRSRIGRSYNAEYMKEIAGKIAARGLQSTY